jgi:hypothetical protein
MKQRLETRLPPRLGNQLELSDVQVDPAGCVSQPSSVTAGRTRTPSRPEPESPTASEADSPSLRQWPDRVTVTVTVTVTPAVAVSAAAPAASGITVSDARPGPAAA